MFGCCLAAIAKYSLVGRESQAKSSGSAVRLCWTARRPEAASRQREVEMEKGVEVNEREGGVGRKGGIGW